MGEIIMVDIPEDIPEEMKYFIFEYKKGEKNYRTGGFIGVSKEAIYNVPRIQELPDDTEIEIMEVNREVFIELVNEIEKNTKNFNVQNFFKED